MSVNTANKRLQSLKHHLAPNDNPHFESRKKCLLTKLCNQN